MTGPRFEDRQLEVGAPLSLRERGFGVRVQFLLNPDAEVKDIFTLTPTLSRRERVVYSSRYRLMPMPPTPIGVKRHRRGD